MNRPFFTETDTGKFFVIPESNPRESVIVLVRVMIHVEIRRLVPSAKDGSKLYLMKKTFALTAAVVFSQAMVLFAGETEISSKNVIQPAPLPPASYFRANEFDLGAFGTYDTTFNQNRRAIGDHAWGGGMSLTYFPWLYAGFGVDWSLVNTIPGHDLAHQVDGKFTLRYPLDLISPNLHLAPYAYGGVGGLFVHTSGSNHHSSVLGSVGGGLEDRFTPHIGIFSDAGYEIVDGPKNNFMQVNFGLKYAF